MKAITWLMLAAAILPFVAAGLSKTGGHGYDNNDPRSWLARQSGWRARANSAQINLFEGLPFFFAAVLFALHGNAEPAYLIELMAAWLVLRIIYLGVYIGGYGAIRTLVWAASLILNIAILFAAPTA
jgi:uncharacterized MAPEG superfamily protein